MPDNNCSAFADVDLDRHGPVVDLLEAEQDDGDRVLIRTIGAEITIRDFGARARGIAAALQARGIQRGDRVALVCGNSIDRACWMFGIWWIGAIEVSVNFELRGPMLQHVIDDSDPALLICHEEFAEALAAVSQRPMLRMGELQVKEITEQQAEQLDVTHRALAASELATILYTSGTTGPAKGVMLPRAYSSNLAQIWAQGVGMTRDDVGYFPLPFFHVDGHVLLSACIQTRSVLAFRPRFSVREYWDDIRRFGATWTAGVGSMLSMIAANPLPDPQGLRLRRVMAAPIPDVAYEYFEDRLGIEVLTLYGQTECDAITIESAGRRRRGSAGAVHPMIDIRIADTEGRARPAGETGEILYRPSHPNLTVLGYWRRPEYTVAAWRNLWFHTGDSGWLDADGFLHFVGRRTDSFRRRGENISAWELETTLVAGPGVQQCIAIAVKDEHGGEDEIKVFVVPEHIETFDLDAFVDYCRSTVARFALPRFVTVTDGSDFVRSPGTGVVHKHLLSVETDGVDVVDISAIGTNHNKKEER